jgi:hypothetical protein
MMLGLTNPSRQRGFSHPGWARVDMAEGRSHPHSEERSQDLLRQWLSPDQAEQYDRCQLFEVVGSDTGTRYRICLGTTMNVEELAANGRVAQRWCFAPDGASATGDVMLAQKIALETFELDALAIANHDTQRGDRRLFLRIDELGLLVVAFACLATLSGHLFGLHLIFESSSNAAYVRPDGITEPFLDSCIALERFESRRRHAKNDTCCSICSRCAEPFAANRCPDLPPFEAQPRRS